MTRAFTAEQVSEQAKSKQNAHDLALHLSMSGKLHQSGFHTPFFNAIDAVKYILSVPDND